MKRLIIVLLCLFVALALLNTFWDSSQATPETTREQFGAGTSDARFKSGLSKGTIHPPRGSSPETNVTEGEGDNEEIEEPKLTREQVEAYLVKTKRSPESLLNAFRETGDTNYLAEAVKNFPENPIVQWTMLFKGPPEERSQWLEKLKKSSPENAMPNYLSALDSFKAGNVDKALAEMDSASGRNYNAFEKERMQSREEMFLLAGYSPLEAKTRSMEIEPGHLFWEMKALAQEISDLQQKYVASGDTGSAQQLAELRIEASRKLSQSDSPFLMDTLAGMAMENNALQSLNTETYYDFLGKTAGERAMELKAQKQEMKDLARIHPNLYSRLSDAEKMIYSERLKVYGELHAWRWLKENYGDEK